MSKRLFVGGLPFSMDDEDLKNLFEEGDGSSGSSGCGAGSVVMGQGQTGVIRDRATNRSKGFGFVEMVTAEKAKEAIKIFNKFNLNGRELKVDIAADRSANSRPRGDGSRRREGGFSGNYSGGSHNQGGSRNY